MHFDVKPLNIGVETAADKSPAPRVLDWGSAHLIINGDELPGASTDGWWAAIAHD